MKTLRSSSSVKTVLGIVLGALLILTGSAYGKPGGPKTWQVPGEDFLTIQEALSSEDVKDGDTIIVAEGTYKGEGFVNLDLGGKAITLKSQSGPKNCTLDAEGTARVFLFNHGETNATVVSGFTITNGSAEYGGGIAMEGASSPTIIDCILTKNTATVRGGAISIDASTPVIVNCLIFGNTVTAGSGGAISTVGSSPTITNCTITGNQANVGGGALYAASASAPVVTNCILWDDLPGEISVEDVDVSAPVVTYSDVELEGVEEVYPGTSNINVTPEFVSVETGDYHLAATSGCVDRGNNLAPAIPETDLDGMARIIDGLADEEGAFVDMGAFEYNPYGPITADFSATPLAGVAPLSVAFTNASEGEITTYDWDFGDGSENSSDANPTHIYEAPGKYTVNLTVTGPAGTSTEVKENYIVVSKPAPAPVAAFTVKDVRGKAPFKVKFMNKSKNAYKYSWDFGDGTKSKVKNPVHDYVSPGSYTVTLTATSKSGATDTASMVITVTPPDFKADFKGSPRSGKAPLKVKFMAKVHKEIGTYAWEFGDGATGEGKTVQHTYTAVGSYDVTLTVTGKNGAVVSIKKVKYIVVTAKGGKK